MAGQLKIGGNIIATHAGTEGAGTVTLDSSTLTIGSNTTISGTIGSGATIDDSLFKAGTGAFCAGYNANGWLQNIANDTRLYFNDDSTGNRFDTDGNYDTTDAIYTIPATGVYYFYYCIYTAYSNTTNAFGFTTNNGELADQNDGGNFGSYSQENDDQMHFFATVQPFTSGDTIWVATRTTANDVYRGHSRWGGCRLK